MNILKSKELKRLFEFAGNYKYLIILACLFSITSTVLSIGPFICIWFIIQDIFTSSTNMVVPEHIIKYGWIAVALALSSIVIYFVALICSHLAAFRVEKNMKKAAMHKIVDLPLGFFRQNTSGKLRKIIDDNAGLTHSFLAHQLPDLSSALIMPLVIFGILFIFDWKLGIVCLVPLLLSIFFLKNMMGGENAFSIKQYMDALEDMNASAVEYVRGIPVVKVFQQTVYSFKNFYRSIENYRKFASNCALSYRIPMTSFTIAINLPSLLLLPAGILLILNSLDYKGFLLNLIFYILFTPLSVVMMNKIMYISDHIMIAKEALNRLDPIFDAKVLDEPIKSKPMLSTEIEFANVSFQYANTHTKALDDISFKLSKGKTYALVGSSGGGKSTIANLILRFWDVNDGTIKIGETNVKNFKEEDLVNKIGFVLQNSKLFKMSLLDNIKIGKPTASKKEILQAAHLAQCDDILEKFSKGIDTVVGQNGVYLSLGEQQRIILARAILKNADIIILDEATAFADPENEYKIQKALDVLTKEKTVLIIAHRLSSIKDVDQIIVLKEGKIIEKGTHHDLTKKNGLYKKMWEQYLTSIEWKMQKEAIK